MKYALLSILFIGLMACRSETNRTVVQQPKEKDMLGIESLEHSIKTGSTSQALETTSSSCFDDMQKALLCRCLYENLKFSTSKEGSINMYLQTGDVPIDEFDSLSFELMEYVELNQFSSFNGSSLAIAECIEAVLLLGRKGSSKGTESPNDKKSSRSNE